AAKRFDAERQRGHVEQQQVLHFAGKHARLDRRADGDHFVGIDALVGLLPKMSFTIAWTRGIRVEPPTSTTSSIFDESTPASASACLVGPTVFCNRSSTICSNFARVSFIVRCLGPVWSAA